MADVSGKATLVTRYFRALRPPQDVLANSDNPQLSAEKISWFVSLIPYLPKNALFPGLPVIWPNCEQLMGMVCGSEIDHSILLANYFSSVGKRAYLLLGKKKRVLRI